MSIFCPFFREPYHLSVMYVSQDNSVWERPEDVIHNNNNNDNKEHEWWRSKQLPYWTTCVVTLCTSFVINLLHSVLNLVIYFVEVL